jgi:ribosomal protein L29
MTTAELRNKSAAELRSLLETQQSKLAQLRFDLADKKLRRTSDIKITKREIARIVTLLRTAHA